MSKSILILDTIDPSALLALQDKYGEGNVHYHPYDGTHPAGQRDLSEHPVQKSRQAAHDLVTLKPDVVIMKSTLNKKVEETRHALDHLQQHSKNTLFICASGARGNIKLLQEKGFAVEGVPVDRTTGTAHNVDEKIVNQTLFILEHGRYQNIISPVQAVKKKENKGSAIYVIRALTAKLIEEGFTKINRHARGVSTLPVTKEHHDPMAEIVDSYDLGYGTTTGTDAARDAYAHILNTVYKLHGKHTYDKNDCFVSESGSLALYAIAKQTGTK